MGEWVLITAKWYYMSFIYSSIWQSDLAGTHLLCGDTVDNSTVFLFVIKPRWCAGPLSIGLNWYKSFQT